MNLPTPRPATSEERALLARRAAAQRQKEQQQFRRAWKEALRLIGFTMPVFVAFGIGLRGNSVLLAFVMAFAGIMLLTGALGIWSAIRRRDKRLEAIAQEETFRASAVTDVSMNVARIVTATNDMGDGVTWWLFQTTDGDWYAFQDTQWGDMDAASVVWRQHVDVAQDAYQQVLYLRSEGSVVPVERGDIRPPDFAVREDTLFWTPPSESATLPLPLHFSEDPILRKDPSPSYL